MRKILSAATVLIAICHTAWATDLHSVDTIRQAFSMPIPGTSLQTAKQVDDQIIQTRSFNGQSVSIINDTRYTRAVQIVGRLSNSFRGGNPGWIVRVLDTNPKTVNAFTVGGNYIYIYTGLLDGVQSDDELAFVVGHEMSHTLLKHLFRRSQDSGNSLAVIIEALGGLSKNSNTKQATSLIGGTIAGAYSREDEREADALGAVIASKAGYDPSRAIDFFKRTLASGNANDAKNQQQLASGNNAIQAQLANCNSLTAQWNSQPQVRTQQNLAKVNAVCNSARANTEQFNRISRQYGTDQLTSILTRTHPVDNERINSVSAETDFLKGARTLQSLAGIGQGYNVLVAINATPTMRGGSVSNVVRAIDPTDCDSLETRARQIEASFNLPNGLGHVSVAEKTQARDTANRCKREAGEKIDDCAVLERRASQYESWKFVSATDRAVARSEADRCKSGSGEQIAAETPGDSTDCAELEARARQFESWSFVSATEKATARNAANQCRK